MYPSQAGEETAYLLLYNAVQEGYSLFRHAKENLYAVSPRLRRFKPVP